MILKQAAVLISESGPFSHLITIVWENMLLENVQLSGAVCPVGGVALSPGRHPAVDQHDLDQDALVTEVPETLDVVTHIASQTLGPALLDI